MEFTSNLQRSLEALRNDYSTQSRLHKKCTQGLRRNRICTFRTDGYQRKYALVADDLLVTYLNNQPETTLDPNECVMCFIAHMETPSAI